MMKIKVLAALAVAALVLPAAAQTGHLTPKETARLEAVQAKAPAQGTKAKAAGKAPAQEKRNPAKSQDKQGKKTNRQKHDKQAAVPAR